MQISRTAKFIRRKVSHAHASRFARWLLIFCVGFYLGHAVDVLGAGWCPLSAFR